MLDIDQRISFGAGKWARFSGYEVRADKIAPTKDAQIEIYDPWEQAAEQDGRSAYAELADLFASLDLPYGVVARGLSTDDQEQVVDWCQRHGLLGILSHRAVLIELAPRWLRGPSRENDWPLAATQIRHHRSANRWRTLQFKSFDPRPPLPHLAMNSLVAYRDRPPNLNEGRILHYGTGTNRGRLLVDGLQDGCWPYFPDVPEPEAATYEYPAPLSEEFWRPYAEPLDEFVEAARSIWTLTTALAIDQPGDALTEYQETGLMFGLADSQDLLEPIGLSLHFDERGHFRVAWESPSLLGTLALMAIQDVLTDGQHLFACASCGKIGRSTKRSAKYCSDPCRWREQKRTYRKNKRAPKGLGE